MQFGLHEELINEAGPIIKNDPLDVEKTEKSLIPISQSTLGKKGRKPSKPSINSHMKLFFSENSNTAVLLVTTIRFV